MKISGTEKIKMKVEASVNTKKPPLEGEGEPRGEQEDRINPSTTGG